MVLCLISFCYHLAITTGQIYLVAFILPMVLELIVCSNLCMAVFKMANVYFVFALLKIPYFVLAKLEMT